MHGTRLRCKIKLKINIVLNKYPPSAKFYYYNVERVKHIYLKNIYIIFVSQTQIETSNLNFLYNIL